MFGSRIWGKSRADSDLDIGIYTQDIYTYFDIEEEISDLNIIYNLDIVNINTINNKSLKQRIFAHGIKILYKI